MGKRVSFNILEDMPTGDAEMKPGEEQHQLLFSDIQCFGL